MINVLRSDFYKLFRTKAFYICGLIMAVASVLFILALNASIKADVGIDASLLGFDGIFAMTTGMGWINIFVAIMISMFIPSEFAYGTIKNVASRGISRVNIYLSKVIIGIFITVFYTLFCAAISFAAGSIMWGTGELTRAVYLDISRMLGLFLMAEIALQCIFMMVGFLIRQTGGTVATNLALIVIVPPFVAKFVNYAVYQWFKVENFTAEQYWPDTYTSKYLSLNISQSDINTGLIVCACYIVLSVAVGMFFFYKRDIK